MRRTLRLQIYGAAAAVALLSAAGCSTNGDDGAEAGADDVYTWDFMIYLPLNQAPEPLYQEFVDEIRERTDGRLDITIRPQGELPYQNTEFLRAVQRGDVEMADANTGSVSGDLSIAQAFNLPFLITTYDEFVTATEVLGKVVEEELQQYNAEPVLSFAWPPQNVWGTGDPVEALADFQGRKIRTYAPEQQDFFNQIGAVPVSLTFEEVPSAINRGVVDGLMTSGLSVRDAKMHEYLDWGYLLRYNVASNYLVVNSESKAALPDDVRQVLEDTAAEFETRISEQLVRLNDEAQEEMRAAGMVITEGDERDRATDLVSSTWEEWAEENGYGDALDDVRSSLGR